MRILTTSLVIAFMFTLTSLDAQTLQDGDRVVFLGDSITQSGAQPGGYVTIVREAIEKARPDSGIQIIGAGISGNKVPDLEARLDRDVISKDPSVVVIYIGINDVWHSNSGKGTPKDKFEAGLNRIIDQLKKKQARVILCTPSVIGEKHDGSNNLDSMLDEYCGISRKIAKQQQVEMIDLRKAFLEYLVQKNGDNADRDVLTTDGVHLNELGNRFVAHQMLLGLGLQHSSAKRQLRHVVLFQFKENVTEDEKNKIVNAFGELENLVDTITGYEHGTNISPENLAQGFTHCFMVSFDDEAGRDAYLPHPAHQDFVKMLDGKIEKVLVVDFWSG